MKRLLSILCALVLLSACGVQGQSAAESVPNIPMEQEALEIRMRIPFTKTGNLAIALEDIVEEYNSYNEGRVHVSLQFGDDDEQAALTDLLARSAELYLLPADQLREFAGQQFLSALSSDFVGERIHFYPSAIGRCTVGRNLYGVPFLGYTQALVCNAALLADSGLPEDTAPDTWEELERYCQAIEYATDAAGISLPARSGGETVDMALQFVHQAGGSLLAGEDNVLTLQTDTPQVREGMAFYGSLCKNYGTAAYAENTSARACEEFYYGSSAMACLTPTQLAAVVQRGREVVTGTLPQGSNGPQAQLYCWAFAVAEGLDAQRRDAAVTLIQYLTTQTVYEKLMDSQLELFEYDNDEDLLLLSLRSDCGELEFFAENPHYLPCAEGAARVLEEPETLRWEQLKNNVLQPQLAAYLRGAITLDEMLDEVKLQGDALLRT